ncbi:hypothetical protein WJX79_005016 [Trebouxia sp. C0005]
MAGDTPKAETCTRVVSPSKLEAGHAANQSPGSIWDKLQTKDAQLGILSMVLLIFQGTALSLILRYSRTGIGPPYLASVAVIWTEFIKLVICIAAQCLVCKKTAREKGITYLREIQHDLRDIISTSFPMVVPAALFVMQQVLVIVAASHLDAVTFQICSQSFKIMPTALFAVWLLGQYLTPMQWASLPVLAVGVVLVTMNGSAGTTAAAGVLGIYGLPLSIAYMYAKDHANLRRGGIMQGFNYLAWTVVALQVFGGLIVGMVVKYADNILKNFANALSVIFTVIGAMPLFGQYPSIFFLFGVVGVLLSVFMYGKSTPSGFGAFDSCYRSMSTANLQLLLQSKTSGEERSVLYKALLGIRRQRPASGRGSIQLLTCARVTALCLSLITGLLLVLATRHPPVQEVLKGGVQKAGELLQGVRTPAFEVAATSP